MKEAGKHSKLISVSDYDKQGVTETEKALAQLREYLVTNPKLIRKVRDESDVRLRRFVDGQNHLETHLTRKQKKKELSRFGKLKSYCTIQ